MNLIEMPFQVLLGVFHSVWNVCYINFLKSENILNSKTQLALRVANEGVEPCCNTG